ncbi:hypothetical protein [Exiguobacterium sp. s168]|uniref:hypothetical protein n=1 Tax=Exiguobacterium sp. s168 TaxID=2751194 RepID=UPI001BEB16DC|nr:hypothetical protein [Exiguobacterium sp. s168]
MNQELEEFVQAVYRTVVKEGMADYKDIYEEEVDPNVNDYTACIAFYQQSSEADQKRMRQMMEQTIIDTVSHVFSIIDGSSGLSGSELEAKLALVRVDEAGDSVETVETDGALQDAFLGYIENRDLNAL